MKISSDELGRILIAFGQTLLDSLNQEVSHTKENEKQCPEDTAGDSGGSTAAVVSGSFDGQVENLATVCDNNPPNDRDRIAELEKEIAKLQSTQNQSGLNLKQIKL